MVAITYDNDGKRLGRLADLFGDAKRRDIFRHLRHVSQPLTASEVAAVFGLHRTVARSHLEKMVELGLVVSGTRRGAGGGRPAKTYVLAAERLEIMLPPRRYERLARLLLRLVVEHVATDVARSAAFEFGRDYGQELSRRLNGGGEPEALDVQVVLGWLDAAGYDVSLTADEPGVIGVDVRNCVYHELAQELPHVVCHFDQGMLCGMLGAERTQHCQTKALATGDDRCRHEFRL